MEDLFVCMTFDFTYITHHDINDSLSMVNGELQCTIFALCHLPHIKLKPESTHAHTLINVGNDQIRLIVSVLFWVSLHFSIIRYQIDNK